MSSRISTQHGFSLVDMLVVVALIGILSAMARPLMTNASDAIKLGQATREVERELQTARLRAVSANRAIRFHFDCPAAGQYRIAEVIGTPKLPAAADSASNRCTLATYPYPADADKNPLTRPNLDGPLRFLDPKVTFSGVTTIEFWPDGSAHTNTGTANPWPPISGAGTTVTLVKGSKNKTILVNGVGKIQVQ